jgi:hypothetical protein
VFRRAEDHKADLGSVSPVAQGGSSPPTLFVSNNWVGEGESKLVWLPPSYRPTCKAPERKSLY